MKTRDERLEEIRLTIEDKSSEEAPEAILWLVEQDESEMKNALQELRYRIDDTLRIFGE
jgi:hypothetical protein